MSVRMMSIVWDVPFPTSTQMLIALKLADYSNDQGTSIFPANETLAHKARCSETTVKTTLKVFRDCGLLVLMKQGGSGPRSTNEWALNVPMLKALASGICTIEGCSTVLEIAGECPVDNKGANSDPLPELRGQFDGLRGQPTGSKGSAHGPQPFTNHQIEPSGASAPSEAGNFDFKGSGKAKPAIKLTPSDGMKWTLWLKHLSDSEREKAEQAAVIEVTSYWPETDGARLLSIPSSGLSDSSKAMAGEQA